MSEDLPLYTSITKGNVSNLESNFLAIIGVKSELILLIVLYEVNAPPHFIILVAAHPKSFPFHRQIIYHHHYYYYHYIQHMY